MMNIVTMCTNSYQKSVAFFFKKKRFKNCISSSAMILIAFWYMRRQVSICQLNWSLLDTCAKPVCVSWSIEKVSNTSPAQYSTDIYQTLLFNFDISHCLLWMDFGYVQREIKKVNYRILFKYIVWKRQYIRTKFRTKLWIITEPDQYHDLET